MNSQFIAKELSVPELTHLAKGMFEQLTLIFGVVIALRHGHEILHCAECYLGMVKGGAGGLRSITAEHMIYQLIAAQRKLSIRCSLRDMTGIQENERWQSASTGPV